MKNILKLLSLMAVLVSGFTACDKVGDLKVNNNGKAPELSSSVFIIAPAPADSDKVAVTFFWTDPKYATSSANEKFVIEIDSTGRNFSKSVSKTITGAFSGSYTSKELNAILLAYGFNFGVTYDMDIRVTSSYGNNNEQLKSNVLKLKMKPYKVPPKVTPPISGRLFIVGDATQGGWTNPVPTPSQELTKLDSVTYGGVFNLVGGKQYLLLPVNGDWSNKYSVADKTLPNLSGGGDFGYNLSDNFPGPATSGLYKIMVDFQRGKFTVTPYTQVLPSNLYIVGDATAGGWTNPVPVPSQQFTQVNSTKFSITVPLTGGKQYLLLPVNGDWSHKFSVSDNSVPGLAAGGDFGYDLPQNFPGPAADGTYKIDADFVNYKFVVTKQ